MKLFALTLPLFLSTLLFGQTPGTLTLNFTQTPHTSYTGTKNVMAVWIETNSGTFVKTRKRNVGGGTKDHLPTWAVKSGGTANNATSAACNTVGATTGATLNNFGAISVTWDGTDVSGNLVADGTYKIIIESTWNHGNTNTTTRTFTFTKGPNADVQSPSDDSNFTGILLSWQPSGVGIEEVNAPLQFHVQPNPSADGIFNLSFNQADKVKVFDLNGKLMIEENVKGLTQKQLNLNAFQNGYYVIEVSNGLERTEQKVLLNQ